MRRSDNRKLQSGAAWTLRHLAAQARAEARTRSGQIKGGTWENELLNGYIAKLYYGGWTLQAIGDALGISRERVRQRCEDATDVAYRSPELPDVPAPLVPPRRVKPPRMRPEFEQWLRDTYAIATRCRGTHAEGSPERVASEQFWAAVSSAMEQGIAGADIARLLGFSARNIYAGLKRHGYRKQSPSQKPYAGKPNYPDPTTRTKCHHGHELAGTNVRFVNGDPKRPVCRTCERERVARYRERKVQLATVTNIADRRSA